MTFDPTKPVQTRDGRPVRILCTDLKEEGYPIAAAVQGWDGSERLESFTTDGRLISGGGRYPKLDLVNVPDHGSFWINVFGDGVLGSPWDNRADADRRKGERGSLLEIRMCDGKLVEAIQHWDEKHD